MSNHGGFYNKCFLCYYLAQGDLSLDRGWFRYDALIRGFLCYFV
jgi:hypothetical protein